MKPLLALALVVAACQTPSTSVAALDHELAAMTARGDFSGVVLVERGGRVLLHKGYGLADREANLANTPAHTFRIGSLTKAFTAMGILVLVERGRLGLDDTLGARLNDCPEAWRAITIDELLRHTSGIPDLVRLPGFFDTITLPTTLARSVARVAKEPLEWPPGAEFAYGNSGYVVAALLIEELGGVPYADFLTREVLAPLHLAATGTEQPGQILPRRAHGYVRHDGVVENAPYLDMTVPLGAGSAYSTVDDLRRWIEALRHPTVVAPALVARMLTPGLGDYGYGWYITTERGRRVVSHLGDINGFAAYLAWLPDEQTSVVVLSNLEGAHVAKIAKRLSILAW